MSKRRTVTFDVITISDRCFRKENIDTSGPLLHKLAIDYFEKLDMEVKTNLHLLPDDLDQIKQLLVYLCDEKNVNLILTTGGTGLAPTDVTPEATSQICEKLVSGISTMMLIHSLKLSKNACLSRAVCGIRKNTLIINFPGSVKGVKECFDSVCECLLHSIDLMNNNQNEVDKQHLLQILSINNEKVQPKERMSPYPLVSLDDAKSIIQKEALQLRQSDTVPLSSALNFVLSDDIYAPCDIPPKDCSLKDGYAVQAPLPDQSILSIIDDCQTNSYKFQSHNCYKISTGFILPPSTNCVIPVEKTIVHGYNSLGCESTIQTTESVNLGDEIRLQGSDIKKGQLILEKSTKLSPEHLALLASARITDVHCYKIPTIGVLSTGDEILDISNNDANKLTVSSVFDSNRLFLINKLKQLGFYNVIDGGIVNDDYEEITQKLYILSNLCDIIITTGSASMGEKDFIKTILVEEFHAYLHFGRINLKPGKPTSFATFPWYNDNKKILFFSLPGNPVSCFVMFNILVRDALNTICGLPLLKTIKIRPSDTIPLTDSRPECYRCKYDFDNNVAIPVSYEQQSSRILSVCSVDLLLLLPGKSDTTKSVSSETKLTAYLLN